jgi:hypothetical protein
VLAFQLFLVNPDKFFAAARLFPETVICDPIQPGRKARLATEAPDVFISSQKSFLREIVRQREVSARKLAQQTSHARLMPAHEFAESVLVVIDKNSSEEIRIG